MSAIEGDEVPGAEPEIEDVAHETIIVFMRANEDLRQLVEAAAQNPTTESVEQVTTTCGIVNNSSSALTEQQFFRGMADEILVGAALGAVMTETQALWELATRLRPDSRTDFSFDEEFREQALEALIAPDDPEDNTQRLRLKNLSTVLYNTHEAAVDNLLDKFMGIGGVIDLHVAELGQEHRKERFQTAGIVLVAAFAGTLAAHWFDRKMGRKS